MTDSFDSAQTALDSAKALMDNFPKKKVGEFIGEWNQLMVFLARQVKRQADEEAKKPEIDRLVREINRELGEE